MMTTVYAVDGMNCNNCANAVSAAIREPPGVAEAVVDLAGRKVAVSAEPRPDGQGSSGPLQ